jgi:hypothetical protein
MSLDIPIQLNFIRDCQQSKWGKSPILPKETLYSPFRCLCGLGIGSQYLSGPGVTIRVPSLRQVRLGITRQILSADHSGAEPTEGARHEQQGESF